MFWQGLKGCSGELDAGEELVFSALKRVIIDALFSHLG
jgi:hypothetical protein